MIVELQRAFQKVQTRLAEENKAVHLLKKSQGSVNFEFKELLESQAKLIEKQK